jgi:hypothetical protein
MDQDSMVVGLDVHTATITAAVLPRAATRPREVVTLENHPKAIARLVKRLTGGRPVVFVYKAGPAVMSPSPSQLTLGEMLSNHDECGIRVASCLVP